MIQIRMSLLDAMSIQMGCAYLSDLRFLNSEQQRRLAQALEKIPADSATLFEWNDALEYLTGGKAALPDAAQARTALMEALAAANGPVEVHTDDKT